jgi:hypothetical protein
VEAMTNQDCTVALLSAVAARTREKTSGGGCGLLSRRRTEFQTQVACACVEASPTLADAPLGVAEETADGTEGEALQWASANGCPK